MYSNTHSINFAAKVRKHHDPFNESLVVLQTWHCSSHGGLRTVHAWHVHSQVSSFTAVWRLFLDGGQTNTRSSEVRSITSHRSMTSVEPWRCFWRSCCFLCSREFPTTSLWAWPATFWLLGCNRFSFLFCSAPRLLLVFEGKSSSESSSR